MFSSSQGQRKELYPVLDALVEEGKIVTDRRGRYEAAERAKSKKKEKDKKNAYIEGIFVGHPKGFGFVEIEGQEDVYISERIQTGCAPGPRSDSLKRESIGRTAYARRSG